jgi:serine/threonine protein kinase
VIPKSASNHDQTRREIGLLRLLDHSHILKLINALENDHNFYIVAEFAPDGELFELLVDSTGLTHLEYLCS